MAYVPMFIFARALGVTDDTGNLDLQARNPDTFAWGTALANATFTPAEDVLMFWQAQSDTATIMTITEASGAAWAPNSEGATARTFVADGGYSGHLLIEAGVAYTIQFSGTPVVHVKLAVPKGVKVVVAEVA